ncbi:MAG: GWxTD domain-containing protein [Cyclobacteriaceae bacterium]|nr:GWxTD domain-containing protein [Cyclobacteriaceae bacterium]MCX7637265.1 GWxTD domain-containing protein [Cyclobacteriaceae bacterium]MDW8331278.1 GWxTD domain-containing protein [Cyclobacteriaceae bacterium]
MIIRCAFLLFSLILSFAVSGQTLRDNNFSNIYNPDELFSVSTICYHDNGKLFFYFTFSLRGQRNINEFSFQAEVREDLSSREGSPLPEPEWLTISETVKSGKIALPAETGGMLVVLKIIMASARRPWFFFTEIPKGKAFALLKNNIPVTGKYITTGEAVTCSGFEPDKPLIISLYEDDFPAALPPFATAQARVTPVLKPSAVLVHQPDRPLSFQKKALVLIQQDTTSAEGIAFRVEEDYPRLATISSLTGPMIYVCEKKEMDKLRSAAGNKSAFDKVILDIVGNTERARIFMRSYFQRVEQANRMFTSYKEGWKTDRGMIYIIFGPPEEVYLLGNREIWEYTNANFKGRFTFTRSATLFDPKNYVLIREANMRDNWYNMVDLWRKARF